jgi:hypothetical protein
MEEGKSRISPGCHGEEEDADSKKYLYHRYQISVAPFDTIGDNPVSER